MADRLIARMKLLCLRIVRFTGQDCRSKIAISRRQVSPLVKLMKTFAQKEWRSERSGLEIGDGGSSINPSIDIHGYVLNGCRNEATVALPRHFLP